MSPNSTKKTLPPKFNFFLGIWVRPQMIDCSPCWLSQIGTVLTCSAVVRVSALDALVALAPAALTAAVLAAGAVTAQRVFVARAACSGG